MYPCKGIVHLVLILVLGTVASDNLQSTTKEDQWISSNEVLHYTTSSIPSEDPEHAVQLLDLGHIFDGVHWTESDHTPVVFWHGMGDSAYGSINIVRLALQRKYPGKTVLSVQVGRTVSEDVLAGYFVNVNRQIEQVCKEILENEQIAQHGLFDAVGFSQGAQFLRGLIQRCPLKEHGIQVRNFVSLGGQHQGVFGLPRCGLNILCDHIRALLTNAAYEKDVQEHLVQAEYWHDPRQEQEYRTKSAFLADINNENQLNLTYRDNLDALENLVLVEFTEDEMVVPRESSLFGFYEQGDTKTLVPLERTRLYLEDRLGLRKMKQTNRLKMIKVPGGHLQFNMTWFMEAIAERYLAN